MAFEQIIEIINSHTRVLIFPLIFLNFVLLLFFICFNFRKFKSFFREIKKRTWWLLLLVILLALFLRIFISPHGTLMFEDEGWYMDTAEKVLEADFNYFSDGIYKSTGWPFIISLSFFLFGKDNLVAHYASSVLGILTVFNIFCLSLLLFKKEKIALWSAFLFSLIPVHIAWSGSAETAVPSVFFVTLALFFSLLYFKQKTNSLLWLSLFAIIFAAQVRMENYFLLPLFLLGLFIFRANPFKKDNFKSVFIKIILIGLILVISLPNLINNLNHYLFNNWNTIDTGQYAPNWGISNFVYNWVQQGSHLFDGEYHPLIFSIFLILGIIYAIKKDKRALIFLGVWFLIFFFIYFVSWPGLNPKSRLFINFYPITAIFAGSGIYFVNNLVKHEKFKKILTLILIVVILLSFLPYIGKAIGKINFPRQARMEAEIAHLAVKHLPDDCLVVSNLPVMISGVVDAKVVESSYFLKQRDANPTSFRTKECILFFKDYTCDPGMAFNPKWQENYRRIEEDYNLTPFLIYHEDSLKENRSDLMRGALISALKGLGNLSYDVSYDRHYEDSLSNFGFYKIGF